MFMAEGTPNAKSLSYWGHTNDTGLKKARGRSENGEEPNIREIADDTYILISLIVTLSKIGSTAGLLANE